MTTEEHLSAWMEANNMPLDKERIIEMRPEEWMRFADHLRRQFKADIYGILAEMNGLVEHDRMLNLWMDEDGRQYRATKKGFQLHEGLLRNSG